MGIDNVLNYDSYMQHRQQMGVPHSIEIQPSVAPVRPAHPEIKPAQQETGARRDDTAAVYEHTVKIKNDALFEIRPEPERDAAFSAFPESIATGDMRKAISDMEKDSLLHEYQYFVGNQRGQTITADEDGVVTRL